MREEDIDETSVQEEEDEDEEEEEEGEELEEEEEFDDMETKSSRSAITRSSTIITATTYDGEDDIEEDQEDEEVDEEEEEGEDEDEDEEDEEGDNDEETDDGEDSEEDSEERDSEEEESHEETDEERKKRIRDHQRHAHKEWKEIHSWTIEFRARHDLTVLDFMEFSGIREENVYYRSLLSKNGNQFNPLSSQETQGQNLRHILTELKSKIDAGLLTPDQHRLLRSIAFNHPDYM
jgi:hypothetical protein